jgi:hypothetical protein
MNPCWLLLVTRGLKVWVPPEIYLQEELAVREAARWRKIFRISEGPGMYSHRRRGLHLIRTLFPEPWRACPGSCPVKWWRFDSAILAPHAI